MNTTKLQVRAFSIKLTVAIVPHSHTFKSGTRKLFIRIKKVYFTEKTYPYPPSEGVVKWVSTEWLDEHLEDKNLIMLGVQPNIHDYIQERASSLITHYVVSFELSFVLLFHFIV